MRTEVIVCQRCCLCIPLRYGLIVWGYARLAFAGLVLFGMSYSLDRFIHFKSTRGDRTGDIVVASVVIVLVIADIILGVVFIIGCHTKNAGLIKKYYYHNLFLLGLMIPFCLYVIGMSLYFMIKYHIGFANLVVYMLSDILGSFTYVVIQIYVVFLIRSQFIKLNTGCQFRFENKVTEAECSLDIGEINDDKMAGTSTKEEYDEDIINFV